MRQRLIDAAPGHHVAAEKEAQRHDGNLRRHIRPATGRVHPTGGHHSFSFIPSWAIHASTPRSAAMARIFAESLRSSPVTISEPQCVMMARGTFSFSHHVSCVRTGAWPISVLPRLRMKERVTVAPSPM